jgi:hypothetical protein
MQCCVLVYSAQQVLQLLRVAGCGTVSVLAADITA